MAESFRKGWDLILHSFFVFRAYPSFLLPILLVWGTYAPAVIYLKYKFPWEKHNFYEQCFIVFVFIFALSFMILMSCAIVLEMIKQIETDKPFLIKAFGKAIFKDGINVIPLAFYWAL